MKLGAIVLDSGDSKTLSDFYARLLDWERIIYDDEWIIVKSKNGEGTPLVFQEIPHYEPPVWPAAAGKQQQMQHLDFYTDDVQTSAAHAIACGATPSPIQFDSHWQVLFDPAGHPFCILPNTPPQD